MALEAMTDDWCAPAAPDPARLRLYKKLPLGDRHMTMRESTSQNALYSTIATSGGVNVPPKWRQFSTDELFVQPR